MKLHIHRSYIKWPIRWYRLQGGWMLDFFGLTIIADTGAAETWPRRRHDA